MASPPIPQRITIILEEGGWDAHIQEVLVVKLDHKFACLNVGKTDSADNGNWALFSFPAALFLRNFK